MWEFVVAYVAILLAELTLLFLRDARESFAAVEASRRNPAFARRPLTSFGPLSSQPKSSIAGFGCSSAPAPTS